MIQAPTQEFLKGGYIDVQCVCMHLTSTAWRKAVIFPIPKSGMSNKHVPGNYRGISLQSVVLKLYTSILNRRLLFLLETYEAISDLQMALGHLEHAKSTFLLFTTL